MHKVERFTLCGQDAILLLVLENKCCSFYLYSVGISKGRIKLYIFVEIIGSFNNA